MPLVAGGLGVGQTCRELSDLAQQVDPESSVQDRSDSNVQRYYRITPKELLRSPQRLPRSPEVSSPARPVPAALSACRRAALERRL